MRYANASWFKSVTDNISLNAGFNQNIDDNRDRSLYLMVTITTDNNLSASSTLQRTNDETGYQLNAKQDAACRRRLGLESGRQSAGFPTKWQEK